MDFILWEKSPCFCPQAASRAQFSVSRLLPLDWFLKKCIHFDLFGFIWIWIYDHKASHASATFFSTMKHLRSGKSVSSSLPLFYFLVLALKRTKNVTIFLIMAFEVDSPHLPLCWLPGWAAAWIRSENSSLSLAPPWTKHATNYECTFSPLKHKQGQAIIPINAI